jgi:hypothetical protein
MIDKPVRKVFLGQQFSGASWQGSDANVTNKEDELM